ncbi:MAG: hypothetical protein IKH11_01020 [Bacteroidales bacterium]|nr:hypothetical protein [Bacteroidales bacterium]
MKKVITFLTILALVVCASCNEKLKNPIEKTATVDLGGQWYVIYNCLDAEGKVIPDFEDFNEGYSMVITFSTSSNTKDSIWVSDTKEKNLLGYQVKVPCNLDNLTFGADQELPNIYGPSKYIGPKAIVKNGKILKGAAKTPSGMPADSIYFELKLSDDYFANGYGYDSYQVTGYRYTGFAADE